MSAAAQAVPIPAPGACLHGADLAGLDLRGRNLVNADFSGADLTGAQLQDADLRGAIFFESTLHNASFVGAKMEQVDLTSAKASGAGFGNADLRHAVLFDTDLSGATLSGADLRHADARRANLDGARMRDAKLAHADLTGATLCGADLRRANITGAHFCDVDLAQACVRGLQGYEHALWHEARIANVDFCGAYLLRRFIMDQNYLHEFRQRSTASNIAYHLWKATSDCGRSFSRWFLCTAVICMAFAALYGLVEVDYGDHETWLSPYYYSVVTLTTLGYGDVLPATVGAQFMAMAEVVVGYVMLGGLLSIFATKMATRAG